jgi:hypothetical protein
MKVYRCHFYHNSPTYSSCLHSPLLPTFYLHGNPGLTLPNLPPKSSLDLFFSGMNRNLRPKHGPVGFVPGRRPRHGLPGHVFHRARTSLGQGKKPGLVLGHRAA